MTPTSFHGRPCTVSALGQSWTFARWEIDRLDDWTDWARSQLPDPLDRAMRHVEVMMEEEERREKLAKTDAEKKALQEWLRRRHKLKDELVEAAMKKASSYLDFLSDEVQSLLKSVRGITRLAWLLLKQNHAEVTQEQALAIVVELGQDRMEEVLNTTMGYAPPAVGNASAPAVPS